MLDSPPEESRLLSWLYVAAASLIIFLTAPFARAIQSVVAEHLGPYFFLYLAAAVLITGGFFALRFLKRRQVGPIACLWLGAVGIAYAVFGYALRDNAVEVIHLVQYGILSLLVYRALAHRVRDNSIYILAVLIAAIIGIVDEWIQWVVPSRYWGLRDIQINTSAAALTQLAIGAGLRPSLISGWPSHTNLTRVCALGAIGLSLIGLSYVNTPERVAGYASRFPALSFLLDSKSMMAEYGYRYDDPEIGTFRSRFTLDELERLDKSKGPELARALDIYINDDTYGEFLEIYSVPRDAYIHEAGVHLFRRNRWLNVARVDARKRYLHYNVVYRENQILEKYFPTGIGLSNHNWTDETRREVYALADKELAFDSTVSKTIITRFNERQVLTGFAVAVSVLILLAAYLRKRSEGES